MGLTVCPTGFWRLILTDIGWGDREGRGRLVEEGGEEITRKKPLPPLVLGSQVIKLLGTVLRAQ